MGINALASAGIVAMGTTLAFLGVVRFFQLLRQIAPRRSAFAGYMLYESGHALREKVRRLDASYTTGFAGGLVFSLTFVSAMLQRPSGWLDPSNLWQRIAVAIIFAAALAVAGMRCYRLIAERRRAVYERDAHIAIGHGLNRVFVDANRVFHAVGGGSLGKQRIDNVIIGPQGVYAVTVVARRPQRRDRNTPQVTIDSSHLLFGAPPERISIADVMPRLKLLTKDLAKLVGHPVNVRSVIAIPGWQIHEQNSDQHLLVNEDRLAMIRGWTDPEAFLMNDQVEAISSELAKRCLNRRPD